MLHKVDLATPLGRMLYESVYTRVLNFSIAIGDADPERLVKDRFVALQAGSPLVLLLVNLEGITIDSHCLGVFTKTPLDTYQAFVEQLQVDSKRGENFIQECEEYYLSYSSQVELLVRMKTTENKARAFRKKYGYEIAEIVMEKTLKKTLEEVEE